MAWLQWYTGPYAANPSTPLQASIPTLSPVSYAGLIEHLVVPVHILLSLAISYYLADSFTHLKTVQCHFLSRFLSKAFTVSLLHGL